MQEFRGRVDLNSNKRCIFTFYKRPSVSSRDSVAGRGIVWRFVVVWGDVATAVCFRSMKMKGKDGVKCY